MNTNWNCVLFLLFSTSCVLCADQAQYAPIVQTNQGKVRGIVQKSEDGHQVYQYQGIRYGRAKRFSKPEAVESWTDVYNATKWRDACPQNNLDKPPFGEQFGAEAQTSTMSEDCLFVNVWRPAEEKANRSVMFYIHGSYTSGTIFSMLYDGRYLASHGDVVVVTVNFRVGVFGLLYGNTTDAPGNIGLQDQILALKWVRDNIHHFGGDSRKITIFGESVGAFATTALILSPLTKGMFRRAIIQSGSPIIFSTNSENKPLEQTHKIAILMKCPTDHVEVTLACLRNKTIKEILDMQLTGPVPKHIFGDEILPIDAVKALKAGKYNQDVDLMYGVTQDEGSYFVGNFFKEFDSNETILTVESTRKYILKLHATTPWANEIADLYTKDLNNSTQLELRSIIGHAFGDPGLVCPTILFGEYVAKLAPKNQYYSYRLTQHNAMPFPFAGGCDGWRGVCHGEDVVCLFAAQLAKASSKPEDYKLSKDMIAAWTSFAKTGHPGKMGSMQWSGAFDETNQFYTRHMSLNANNYQMVSNYYKPTCNAFWQPKYIPEF